MATPISDNPFAVLTLIAAPAVFTNASSVLALGTGNRLARVVDRTRLLSETLRKNEPGASREMYTHQLGRLRMRTQKLVKSMTCFYTAVGAFAAASLVSVLGASLAAINYRMPFAVIAVFSFLAGTAGFLGLSIGSVLLIQETRLAVKSLREESELTPARSSPPHRS